MPDPSAPPPTPPRVRLAHVASAVRRHVVAAFTDQIALKGIAAFLAVGLWFMVNVKEPQVELVPVRLVPTLDSSLVLRDPLPPIQALVAGSPRELIKLNSNPPIIRREISSDAPDTLVIDLRPADVRLPDGVEAVVSELSPRSVTLRFESTWSRKVPVRPAIELVSANGVASSLSVRIDPATVEVTGPRHLVARLPFVRTVRTTIAFPDSLPHLVELDTSGLGAGIRLHPSQVKVLVTPGVAR